MNYLGLLLLLAFHIFQHCQSREAERFSQVRRLSGLAYSEGHNIPINHSLAPSHFPSRPLFRWHPGNYVLNGTATTAKPPPESKVMKKKKKGMKKKKKEKANVWWPWANYEEWLSNHKQDQALKSNVASKSKPIERKRKNNKNNNKKGEKKKKKKKQNKNKKDRKAKDAGNKQKEPNTTVSPRGQTVPGISIVVMDHKVAGGMTKGEEKVAKVAEKQPAEEERKLDGVIKVNEEMDIVQNMAPESSGVEYMTRGKEKSVTPDSFHITDTPSHSDREEDNEIRQFYHWIPSWKNSVLKVTRRNFTADKNECLDNNGGCEGLCINTPGSYYCHCPPGFRLDSSRRKCLDVNECLLRNGHGPCQGECQNKWGSYKCGCTTVLGTELGADGRSCRPRDSCASANCSHMCINTRSGAFCTCPQGYVLAQDWRTCQDVDECLQPELQDPKCEGRCTNLVGSYLCS